VHDAKRTNQNAARGLLRKFSEHLHTKQPIKHISPYAHSSGQLLFLSKVSVVVIAVPLACVCVASPVYSTSHSGGGLNSLLIQLGRENPAERERERERERESSGRLSHPLCCQADSVRAKSECVPFVLKIRVHH